MQEVHPVEATCIQTTYNVLCLLVLLPIIHINDQMIGEHLLPPRAIKEINRT